MANEEKYETLLIERRDGIAIVTLNRPEVLNAFNPKMGKEILAAFRVLADDDDSRVVILTGAGRGARSVQAPTFRSPRIARANGTPT
jgi:enoyl-CoA hydratase/carnithine racemase